jgi:membrane protein required for colicin V production
MPLDIFFIVLFAWGAYSGYKKGLIIELISLLAFVLAFMIAFKLLHYAMELMQQLFSLQTQSKAMAFIAVFLLVFFGIFYLGKILVKVLHYTLVGSIDKFLGAILGVVKNLLFLSVVLWLANYTPIATLYSKYSSQSILFQYVSGFARFFMSWVSKVIPFTDLFSIIQK